MSEERDGEHSQYGHESITTPEPNLETKFAHSYLEKTALPQYFDAINPDTPESLQEAKHKLEPLTRHLRAPRNIVSVGVGAGEETQAAAELFTPVGATIHGLDLSTTAVERARERMAKYGLPAEIIEGSAIDMPFEENSIDAFILSSIMHEIYSYVPNGKAAWKKAIEEVAQKSAPDGKLLLRDFAAPQPLLITRCQPI